MSHLVAFVRSQLREPEITKILTKIAFLYTKRENSVLIVKGSVRYEGRELTSLVITPGSSTGTIAFDDGAGVQTYDKADIKYISRLRSRRYKIVIKPNANPA